MGSSASEHSIQPSGVVTKNALGLFCRSLLSQADQRNGIPLKLITVGLEILKWLFKWRLKFHDNETCKNSVRDYVLPKRFIFEYKKNTIAIYIGASTDSKGKEDATNSKSDRIFFICNVMIMQKFHPLLLRYELVISIIVIAENIKIIKTCCWN